MILLSSLALIISNVIATRFVAYVGQAGKGWGEPANNEEFLKAIGVPGYGSKGYNIINLSFWVTSSNNGGAAVNGGAFEWQNILNRITSSTLRHTLTGTTNPSASQLRAGIKALYKNAGYKLFISAFGAEDLPMAGGYDAKEIGKELAAYAERYQYDGVDIDWEEGINGKFDENGGGEVWLCDLTEALRGAMDSTKQISHAPQAPYFIGSTFNKYPNGGYATIHRVCGDSIDFYNMQYYNQGGKTYNTYHDLFVEGIQTQQPNSAVYQIIDGTMPEEVRVPQSKLIVGKHIIGDGNSPISGEAMKKIFNEALADGKWNAGFMIWNYWFELYPKEGTPLIDSVIEANWDAPCCVTPAPAPAPTGNLKIVNSGDGTRWYWRSTISLKTIGYTLTNFEIQKDDEQWLACKISDFATECTPPNGDISLPLSVRLTATKDGKTSVIIGNDVVTSFEAARKFDFGSNFGDLKPSTTKVPIIPTPSPRTSTAEPSAAPTDAPTRSSGDGCGSITITNRKDGNSWWYMVTISSDVPIDSLELKGNGMSDWEMGAFDEWETGVYTFSKNAEYFAPLSYRIMSNGQETIANNVMNSFDEGESVTIKLSCSRQMNGESALIQRLMSALKISHS